MTAYLEAFRAALTSLLAHRMRSFLTTLGILIGTASVIAVVSLIQGFSALVSAQFADIGGSTLTLQAHTPFDEAVLGRENFLTFADDFNDFTTKSAGDDTRIHVWFFAHPQAVHIHPGYPCIRKNFFELLFYFFCPEISPGKFIATTCLAGMHLRI